MKSNCKTLFRLLILMLVIPFFSDCERDDHHEEYTHQEDPFKTFSDFPELAGFYEKSITNQAEISKSNSGNFNSLYDFSIDQSRVRKITRKTGTDYTMRIYRDNPLPDGAFENLVIKDQKGEEPKAWLVKYMPDDYYRESLYRSTDVPFTGDRYAVPLDFAKIQEKRESYYCVTITIEGDCSRPADSFCDDTTTRVCVNLGSPGLEGQEGNGDLPSFDFSNVDTSGGGGGGTTVVTRPININPTELIDKLGFHPRSKEAQWISLFENDLAVVQIHHFIDDHIQWTGGTPPDVLRDAKAVVEVLSGSKDHTALTNKRQLNLFLSIVSNRLRKANEEHRGQFPEITETTLSINLALEDTDINPDSLTVQDLQFIAKQYNTMYAIAESNVYNKENIRIASNSVASAALLPQIKSLVGSIWPKNAEEWAALGQIMAPMLLEVGLSVIPGADIIDVVKGIAENDYVMVTIALAGLAVDLAGGTLIKVAAKFTKAMYKGFKVVRAIGDNLVALGKVLKKDGYSTAFENGILTLKKKSNRPGQGNGVIAKGDDAVKAYVKTSSKLDDLGLDAALRNDPNVVKALQKIDCN